MSSRLLSDLHPMLEPRVRAFLVATRAAGFDVLVTCTYRSNQEQEDLYAIGRTKPGRRVTNARAGQSPHNFTVNGRPAALAVDVVPMRHGKPVWGLSGNGIDNDPSDDDRDDLELWQRVREYGEKAGLVSASRWKGDLVEWPHFEEPTAKTLMAGGAT